MKSKLVLLFSFLFVSQLVQAGNFDCSVVYDEYDSLMNKRFLINPSHYVDTQSHRISRHEYNSEQKGQFVLRSEHQGYGVAIFRTNKNTYGKFLYTWGAPWSPEGNPSLIIKDLVKYGRVLDGYKPVRKAKIVVPSSYTVDLDTFRVGAGSNSDIWFHNVNGSLMYLEAKNGANLYFPMESLCQ